MSGYRSIPIEIQAIAERDLTEKQLHVFRLYLAGWSIHAMALALAIDRRAVKDRLEGARKRLSRAGVEQTETGEWTLAEKEIAA